MHHFIKIIIWIVFIYSAYCCLLFLLQRRIIFPRHVIGSFPESVSHTPELEKIWLDTSYGKIESWYLPPDSNIAEKPAPVIIFAHGNAELIDFCPEDVKPFTHLGIGILLVEYPGYGRSEGTPSQESITETFIKAYDTITARKDVDAEKIILLGRSVGGCAVCALSTKRPSAALILVSSLTSIRSFATKYLVPGFLVRDPFDNLAAVSAYSGPVLIIHGKYDNIIPYKHGNALYKAARNGKLVTYACGHNDCPPNYAEYIKEIKIFLQDSDIIRDNRPLVRHNGDGSLFALE